MSIEAAEALTPAQAARAPLSQLEARARWLAERRWAFCKTWIEPHIKEASNDISAESLLPNHEGLIRSWAKAQCIVKCRKTAHSWGIALKALAICATEKRATVIIESYDEDEAKEKNNFLEWQYGVLPPTLRRQLKMSDGSQLRRFANGSRIKFIARKAPTGAGAYIMVDEFSVEKPGGATPTEILIAALGATTHTGCVNVGGTQRGPDTMFNQIASGTLYESLKDDPLLELLPKVNWEVLRFPWWRSPALCVNPAVPDWLIEPMPTADRVRQYGNEKLKTQYVIHLTTPDLGEDIFQREFEMAMLDDSESYYSYALISMAYPRDREDYWFEWADIDGDKFKYGNGDIFIDAKLKIMALASMIRRGALAGQWGFAMDVGRDNDQDEIWIGHTLAEDRHTLAYRLNIGMNKMPFPGKRAIIKFIMDNLPISLGYIDATHGGLGRELSEWANLEFGQRVMPFEFTTESKQTIATSLRTRLECLKVKFPPATKFRKLESQILKVKRLVNDKTQVVRFDVERNKNFHGDCFWSAAMLNDLFGHPTEWMPAPSVFMQQVGLEDMVPGRTLPSGGLSTQGFDGGYNGLNSGSYQGGL